MEEVNKIINENRGSGRKDNFNRMESLLDLLDHPEEDLKFIHVAGTNGKGSVSVMMEAILRASDYRTGLFTSPHMVRLNERFRVNNEEITDEDLIRLTDTVYNEAKKVEEESGEQFYSFEIQTAMTFLYYQEQKVDVVVLETGIGGMHDATNVIKETEVSIITNIGLDHQGILGNTLEEVAAQKAGIIKPQGTVVTYPNLEAVEKVIESYVEKNDAEWKKVEVSDIEVAEMTLEYQYFNYKHFSQLRTGLTGQHQAYNGAVAVEATQVLRKKGYDITEKSMRQGLEKAFIEGRFELVHRKPTVLLEGAHNVNASESLQKNLEQFFPEQKIHFVMGALSDKDYIHMIESIEGQAASFNFVAPNSVRAVQPEKLQEIIQDDSIPMYMYDAPEEVVSKIKKDVPEDEIVVVFGSLYLVGDMRSIFLEG
jgi:dihydrofolate synthase/folylpolyglutamate synthase